jgi:colicin import membrane protein
MARKLKTYRTSLGFFDLAVAAPSIKAAAEAWGLKTSEFKRGFAKETHDPEIVAATMAKPRVVLRRPVGSNGRFTEDASCRGTCPSRRLRHIERRQRNLGLLSSTIKPPAQPHLRSRESRNDGKRHVERRRPDERRNASGVSRQSQRRKERLNKPGRSTKPGPKRSRMTALNSRRSGELRTPAGKSRGRNLKPLLVELANNAACDPAQFAPCGRGSAHPAGAAKGQLCRLNFALLSLKMQLCLAPPR